MHQPVDPSPVEALFAHIQATNQNLVAQLRVPFRYKSLLESLQAIAKHYDLPPPEASDTVVDTAQRLLDGIRESHE